MKGCKEAYESIFHYYNEYGSHENSFYLSNIYWIDFLPNQSFMNILHGFKLAHSPYLYGFFPLFRFCPLTSLPRVKLCTHVHRTTILAFYEIGRFVIRPNRPYSRVKKFHYHCTYKKHVYSCNFNSPMGLPVSILELVHDCWVEKREQAVGNTE